MSEVKKSGWKLKEVQMGVNASINNVKNGFVGTGYYLGIIRSEKLWKEDGSASFDEYMSKNYQKDKSWASKCISVYDQFGERIEPGEKPRLRTEYQEYNVSQLFELIYLPEEKREEVTSKTPVKAIRELKPKKEKKVSTVETPEPEKLSAYGTAVIDRIDVLREEMGERCQFVNLELAYHRAGDHEPVPCCKECYDPCQYACERAPEPQPQLQICDTDPLICPHREDYSCTLTPDQKNTPGDGSNCTESCCWECTKRGECKWECNSSASRPEELEPEPVPSEPDPVIDTDYEEVLEPIGELRQIGELELSCRTENILRRAGIDTVDELVSRSDEELAAVRGMSNRAMEEIRTKLSEPEPADKAEPEESMTDLEIAQQELDRANNLLKKCLKDVPDETNVLIRGMKIKVAALASFVCDLDDIENPPPKPERIYTLEEVGKEITRLEAAFLGAPEDVKQSAPHRKNVMRLDAMRLLYDSMKG